MGTSAWQWHGLNRSGGGGGYGGAISACCMGLAGVVGGVVGCALGVVMGLGPLVYAVAGVVLLVQAFVVGADTHSSECEATATVGTWMLWWGSLSLVGGCCAPCKRNENEETPCSFIGRLANLASIGAVFWGFHLWRTRGDAIRACSESQFNVFNVMINFLMWGFVGMLALWAMLMAYALYLARAARAPPPPTSNDVIAAFWSKRASMAVAAAAAAASDSPSVSSVEMSTADDDVEAQQPLSAAAVHEPAPAEPAPAASSTVNSELNNESDASSPLVAAAPEMKVESV